MAIPRVRRYTAFARDHHESKRREIFRLVLGRHFSGQRDHHLIRIYTYIPQRMLVRWLV